MQSKEIEIGETYAIKESLQESPFIVIVRFKATAIVSIREGRNSKATTWIRGIIAQGDLPGQDEEQRERSVKVEYLLGIYTEYAELKAKEAEEKRLSEEETARKVGLGKRLQDELYRVTGISRNVEIRWQPQPFSTCTYGCSVDIRGEEAVSKLVEILERIK
jgi:hypothetical protein